MTFEKRAAPASLRALLQGSVDYAGLFPPANLTLAPVLENYAAYQRGDEAWLLAGCVIPTHRLTQVAEFLPGRFDAARPLKISALGGKSDSAAEAFEILRAGLAAVAGFCALHGDSVRIEQLELPLPPDPKPAELLAFLREAAELIASIGLPRMTTYWEIPPGADWAETLGVFAEIRSTCATSPDRAFAAKLRTGGVTASAIPSVAQVAAALVAACDAGVPAKFTAGLHHPLRHSNGEIGAPMHGFINVFAAGVLAREHGLDRTAILKILEDEAAGSFQFSDDEFAWRDLSVPTDRIASHREFVTTFGSCSFDEPVADLQALGWL